MRSNLPLFILLLWACATASAQRATFRQQVDSLDAALARTASYVEAREKLISENKRLLAQTQDPRTKVEMAYHIYENYRSYINDSALVYIDSCVHLSQKANMPAWEARARAMMAFQCSTSGLFHEAVNILDNTNVDALDRDGLADYYKALNHVYGELGYYTKVEHFRQRFYDECNKYGERLAEVADSTNDALLQRRELNATSQGNFAEALRLNDTRLRRTSPGSHQYAIVAFYRYLIFRTANQTDSANYWLMESAVNDVRNGVMDQGAMWEVANVMKAKGDINRSYRYISYAADCANKFGTRVRNWQISPILSYIEKDYKQLNESKQRQLRWGISLISLLALLVLASLIYVNRQRKLLEKSHKQLAESNRELDAVNRELDANNQQLHSLNHRLSTLNDQLVEGNRVTEEYVGRFMRMCSIYIDKMDKMRKLVNKKIKNHDYEELYNMTRSQSEKERELDELYEQFDSAFLHLFPNFVEDFNALLRPEERIKLDNPERLNTSIRIFALIRLGIDDSSKIAEFLHYSVNTIYNYRARVKNGALADRDNFEMHVKELGTPQ